jgi:hypothetical protein
MLCGAALTAPHAQGIVADPSLPSCSSDRPENSGSRPRPITADARRGMHNSARGLRGSVHRARRRSRRRYGLEVLLQRSCRHEIRRSRSGLGGKGKCPSVQRRRAHMLFGGRPSCRSWEMRCRRLASAVAGRRRSHRACARRYTRQEVSCSRSEPRNSSAEAKLAVK